MEVIKPSAGSQNLPKKPLQSSNKVQVTKATPKKQSSNQKPSFPTPPPLIKDKKTQNQYYRGKVLGQGGFARCYEVWEQNHEDTFNKPQLENEILAAKIIPKYSLKAEKAKQKLFTEIKIHQNLNHANIVKFLHVFEDTAYVYILMEKCRCKTVIDLLRHRKRLSEHESRYLISQLLDALDYMHRRKRVVHRDLKLGNLFLDWKSNSNRTSTSGGIETSCSAYEPENINKLQIKVGDFGLATVIKYDGERKKTICGTPNYIAPEVLFDRETGHSYEVDLWSLGVIIYTMLVGRPPFQTKQIKQIYHNIKHGNYTFPEGVKLSGQVKDLIAGLLVRPIDMRLGLEEVKHHAWFRMGSGGGIPGMKGGNLTPSGTNMKLSEVPGKNNNLIESKRSVLKPKSLSETSEQRKPLSSTIQKKPRGLVDSAVHPQKNTHKSDHSIKHKELTKQPRISDQFKVIKATAPLPKSVDSSENQLQTPKDVNPASEVKRSSGDPIKSPSLNTNSPKTPMLVPSIAKKVSMLESMYDNLSKLLDGYINKEQTSSKLDDLPVINLRSPKTFISKWIDYSNKYGVGYQLTNGCVGVYFNDCSSIVLAANGENFEYLEYAKSSRNSLPRNSSGSAAVSHGSPVENSSSASGRTVMNRHAYTLTKYPDSLKKKVSLLSHFKKYMQENLYKSNKFSNENLETTVNLPFLLKYIRTKHAVVFRLTNRVIQVNFFDHTKILLHDDGFKISVIARGLQTQVDSAMQSGTGSENTANKRITRSTRRKAAATESAVEEATKSKSQNNIDTTFMKTFSITDYDTINQLEIGGSLIADDGSDSISPSLDMVGRLKYTKEILGNICAKSKSHSP